MTYVSQLSENNIGQGDHPTIRQGLIADIPQLALGSECLKLRLGPVHHRCDVLTSLRPGRDTFNGHCFPQDIDVAVLVLVDMTKGGDSQSTLLQIRHTKLRDDWTN